MAYPDLRAFLTALEAAGELLTLDQEVNPHHDLGAYCRILLDEGGPAVRFPSVRGHALPLVSDVLATRKRFGIALETSEDRIHETWLERTESYLDPVIVSPDGAPCKDVILHGDDVDLSFLPAPTMNEFDGGPYITFGVLFSKDPDTGQGNLATYRIQVHGKNRLGVMFAPYRHLALHRSSRLEEEFPIAIALGLDPTCHIAAATPAPAGIDEIGIAGALRQEPVEMVPCETVPLEVPATAEIVLEGVLLPGELQDEGPFGEFTGYYSGVAPMPVVEIRCVTHRKDPIYLSTYQGRPPQDSTLLQSIPGECEILRSVPLPGIKDIYMTEGGCGAFNAVVSVEKRIEGYGRMVGTSVLGTWAGRFIKNLIVVDDSVDVRDHIEVERAMALQVQPHRDVDIIKNMVGVALDPSLPPVEARTRFSRTSKMIIDASGYRYEDGKELRLCMPSEDAMRSARATLNGIR